MGNNFHNSKESNKPLGTPKEGNKPPKENKPLVTPKESKPLVTPKENKPLVTPKEGNK